MVLIPDYVYADEEDTVDFVPFFPYRHTAVQGDPPNPCRYMRTAASTVDFCTTPEATM